MRFWDSRGHLDAAWRMLNWILMVYVWIIIKWKKFHTQVKVECCLFTLCACTCAFSNSKGDFKHNSAFDGDKCTCSRFTRSRWTDTNAATTKVFSFGGFFPEKRYLIETASLQVRDSFCRRQSLWQTSSILKIAYWKLQKQTDTTVCVTMFNMDKVAVLAVLCELDLDFKNLLLHTKTLLND